MHNSTTGVQKSQGFFEKSELHRVAEAKKVQSRILSRYLEAAGLHQQANYMATCGDTLIIRQYTDMHADVAAAIYCRQRLCPTCQWRRARKASGQLSGVMDYLDDQRRSECDHGYSWIALTYSPRNVLDVADLDDHITRLASSFRRLMRCRPVQRAVLGAVRCIEVRRSDGKYNEHFRGSWQVHIHAVLCVTPGYYHSRNYLSRESWGQLLAQCLDITYIPQFFIQRVDGTDQRPGLPAETAKYITKMDMPVDPSNPADLASLVAVDDAIRGRHMIQYYGNMRDAYRHLYRDDPEAPDADLTDIKPTRPDLDYILLALRYHMGVGYQLSQIDLHRDRLLLSRLPEPGIDGTTGEVIVPAQLDTTDRIHDLVSRGLAGSRTLHGYGA